MDGQTPSWARKWLRRLALGLGVSALLAAGALGAVPWLLGTAPGRQAVLGAANRALWPSRVRFESLSASWSGPVRLTGLMLHDRHGKLLVSAKSATVDRGLVALALRPDRLGTVTLDGAVVDIERRDDGSIDLVDALSPPSPPPPPVAPAKAAPAPAPAATGPSTSGVLRVTRGSLRLRSPELAEPIVAGSLEMEATLPAAAGEPLSWRIRLAAPGGVGFETLGVDGSYDHRAPAGVDPDLSLTLQGHRWPVALAGAAVGADLRARAQFDGTLTVGRAAGAWSAKGDARLLELDAKGPALAGDRLKFDRVSATWDLGQTADAWAVRSLELTTPVGKVSGRGAVGDRPDVKAEANLDLAALAKQAPHLLRLRPGLTLERGGARVAVTLATRDGVQTGAVEATLSDLAARQGDRRFTLKNPADLTARATRSPKGFALDSFALKGAFADLKGSGDLDRGVTLGGTLDLAALEAQFRELIDFGAVTLAGRGRMAADFRRVAAAPAAGPAPTFVARYAAEITGLKVNGVAGGPVERASARFDAVVTGAADPTGLPSDWTGLRVTYKADGDNLTVAASQKTGLVAGTAAGSLPVTVNGVAARVDAKVSGRWAGVTRVAEFDELRLTARPADPALAAAGHVGVAVRGRLDLNREDLELTPLPGPPPAGLAVVIEPPGISAHGFSAVPAAKRTLKAGLSGDAAALDRAVAAWTGRPAYEVGGRWSLKAQTLAGGVDGLKYSVQADVKGLTRPGPDGKTRVKEGDAVLAAFGRYKQGSSGDVLTVEQLALGSPFAAVSASGAVNDPLGRVAADLRGTLTPNWPGLTALAAQTLEPGLKLTGGARPFHVRGPLTGASLAAVLKGLDAELGLDLASADAFGMNLGPAPLVVRCANGVVTVDPVVTTLNGGRVDLKPGLDVDEARGVALTFAAGSSVTNAQINDEVSRRVLRYVAPVLDKATHVNGRVSLTLQSAEVPLACPPDRRLNLTGQLVFQDVVFAPGPFASEVLTLAGRPDSPGLKLHQPVQLAVADGRVVQKGLEIPIRPGASVAMQGSVGFDQTLDLVASVPLPANALGKIKGLEGLTTDQRVNVPIGGTVERPKVNRQALQVALKALSRDVMNRGLSQGASRLLDRLAPADAAPAPEAGAPSADPADPVNRLEDELLKRVLPRRGGGNNRRP